MWIENAGQTDQRDFSCIVKSFCLTRLVSSTLHHEWKDFEKCTLSSTINQHFACIRRAGAVTYKCEHVCQLIIWLTAYRLPRPTVSSKGKPCKGNIFLSSPTSKPLLNCHKVNVFWAYINRTSYTALWFTPSATWSLKKVPSIHPDIFMKCN